ncbi:MAG: hypothetical protein ACJAZ2_001729 [Glaciecola sp.]|jgi:hypothetical protein
MNSLNYKCGVLFILIAFVALTGVSQTKDQITAIDNDYNKFKTQLSSVMGGSASSAITVKKYSAKFPRSLIDAKQVDYSVGISDPFSPPLEATHQALRRACFIQALKSNCKTFAIFDYYSKYSPAIRGQQAVGIKEMAHVFVDSLYDLRGAVIVNHEYLQSGELILTVDFSKCEKTGSTALFEVYKSTKEKGKGIRETSAIKIIDRRNKSDYKLKKDYHAYEIISKDVSKNENFGDFYFSYSSYNTKFSVKGGLWSHMLLNLSSSILLQASKKTTSIKAVKDFHVNNMVVDLMRTSGFFSFNFQYKSFLQRLRKF